MEKKISEYVFSDMRVIYLLNEEDQTPELLILPEAVRTESLWDGDCYVRTRNKPYPDSLFQIKLTKDAYGGGYSGGITMRQGQTPKTFCFSSQNVIEDLDPVSGKSRTRIVTELKDERGYRGVHTLSYVDGYKAFRSCCEFINESSETAILEMLASFSLGKLSPLMEVDGYDTMMLHRIRSAWSIEGRHEVLKLDDLQLEPSWGGHAVRCERFGTVGSLPVNRFFPVMVLEDSANEIYWGAQIAHNASWQMEVYRRGDDIAISGGLADREFGHWMKNVAPGESFTTPEAILSVSMGKNTFAGEDEIWQRMTDELNRYVDMGPACEQALPVMFNEYCTTWGCPSHENIRDIVNVVKGRGLEYFVIDAGWYKQDGLPWDLTMGEYEPSATLFPEGLQKTVDLIHDAGMKAGLWFEVDNVGQKSKAYQEEEMLLHRDGAVLTTLQRRFWDLRREDTQKRLETMVTGTLKKYGFEYIKMDCNDTVGLGCDGAESLGEGLRQNQAASMKFIRGMKEAIPGLVVENCASGGHKLEPLMMSESSMASFSDAHECREIPIIAATLHRTILPRQSQIWAVIHKEDTSRRIAYQIASTFLGRMCLSGDVWLLNEQQWSLIEEGISLYKEAAPIIKTGSSRLIESNTVSLRHPTGWQALLRKGEQGLLVVIHGFSGAAGAKIELPIPEGMQLERTYSHREIQITDQKKLTLPEDDMAVVLLYR